MAAALSKEEKKRFLKALEEDEEFRYAVAGLIGVSEILKRLDRLEANQEKLWLEVKSLRENQEKLWIEVKGLREGQEKLWLEVKSLRENQEKMWIELKDLRVSVERLTLTVEEEGRDVIRSRLKSELNVDVTLDRIWVDSQEINIYGASGDLCVVGEATVRLVVKLLDELEEKIDYLKGRRPDLLRSRLIKVVYVDYAVPLALEKAKAKGIWVLKCSGDLTPRVIHSP